MDDHVPEQLVVLDRADVHEDPQKVDRGDRHDARRHLVLEAACVHLAEPTEALRILFVKVEPGDEVLVGRVHDHHDQAAHKAHVDHREKREDEIGLRELEDVRQHVPDLLKELERKCQKRKRQAEKERRKNPARCRRVFRRTIPWASRMSEV